MELRRLCQPSNQKTNVLKRVFRMLRFALTWILMMVVAEGYAFAESTVDPLGIDGNVQCDAFKRNPGGSWTTIRQSVVTIGPDRLSVDGLTFEKKGIERPGVTIHVFVGPHDLADVLDRTCGSART